VLKSNKGRLLAGLLAATALIALVGSASASAAVWKDGGKEVTTAFELQLHGAGNYEIESGAGGIQCEEHMTISSTGKSNATISAFKNEKCGSPFGTLAGCSLQSVEVLGVPWGVTLGASTETISSMHVKHKFKTGCAHGEINETLNVTMTPILVEETNLIEGFELLATTEGGYRQVGSYTIEGASSGTYEIG
jgi:hypothetical protein